MVRMLIFITSRSNPKVGHIGLKTMSLGQIIEKKTCVHSIGQNFDRNFMKICRKMNPHKI